DGARRAAARRRRSRGEARAPRRRSRVARAPRRDGLGIRQGRVRVGACRATHGRGAPLTTVLPTVDAPCAVCGSGGADPVEVPNAGVLGASLFGRAWSGLELPRHLSHFTPATLELVLGKADGRIVWCWHHAKPRSTCGVCRRCCAIAAGTGSRN